VQFSTVKRFDAFLKDLSYDLPPVRNFSMSILLHSKGAESKGGAARGTSSYRYNAVCCPLQVFLAGKLYKKTSGGYHIQQGGETGRKHGFLTD